MFEYALNFKGNMILAFEVTEKKYTKIGEKMENLSVQKGLYSI